MIRLIVVFLFLVILTGCGVTFGGGAAPTQTPAPPAVATATPVLPASQELERLRQENQRLQDQLRQQQQQPPAAQATPTPGGKGVATLGPGAAADGVICRADKIATVNEVDHAGPQRMEVSTGDVIHLDYYRERGVPAVSVVVHKDESAVLKGFGSMWQFPLRDCSSYDFIKDATDYARVRQVWNHSGLVYASLSDYLAERPPSASLYGTDPKRVRPTVTESRMALQSTRESFAKNQLPEVTLDQLRSERLVR